MGGYGSVRLVVRAGPEVTIAAFLLGHRPATDCAIAQLAVAAACAALVDVRRLAERAIASAAVPIAILFRLVPVVGGAAHAAGGLASGFGDGHGCARGQPQQVINGRAPELQMALQSLGILVEHVPAGSKGRRLIGWGYRLVWFDCPGCCLVHLFLLLRFVGTEQQRHAPDGSSARVVPGPVATAGESTPPAA